MNVTNNFFMMLPTPLPRVISTFFFAAGQRTQRLLRCSRVFVSVPAVEEAYRILPMSDRKAPSNARPPGGVYLSCYATVLKAVDARYDIRGYVLARMVRLCLQNRGTVPLALRAQYAQYAQKEAFAFLEGCAVHLLFGPAGRFSPHEYRYQVNVDP